MAYINKSDPTALEKLRAKVAKEKQEEEAKKKSGTTTQKNDSPATGKSDPIALQKLRKKVATDNPEYFSTPRQSGGATLKSAASLLNIPATNNSSFTDTTRNSLTTFNNKRNGKTTIESEMTGEERKARIDEIDSELFTLKKARSGLERAKLYGGVGDTIAKNEARQAELQAEREKLQSEAKKEVEFNKAEYEARVKEIDEQLKVKNARFRELNDVITLHAGEREYDSVYNSALSEQDYVDHEIQALKKLKKAYEKAIKNGGVVNEDDFIGQFKANYTVSDISRNMGKVANDYIDNAVALNKDVYADYDAEGDPEMQRAIEIQSKLRQESNEAQSQINKESAEIYNNLSKVFQMNNAEALDEEGRVLPWISKSVAGYLPQLVDQAKAQAEGGAYGFLLGNAIGQGGRGASVGAGIASGMQEYEVMRGTVYMTLIENGVDEETAIEAASDEALISGLIEGGSTMVGWMLAAPGNAWKAVTDMALKNVAKGTAGVATKAIAGMGVKGTAKAVTKPLWRKVVGTGARVLGNALTEEAEEFLQQGVSIANEKRTKQGETGKANLVGESFQQIKDAVTGKDPEALAEMKAAGKEGRIIGLLFGGGNTIVNSAITYYATAETREQQNDVADFIRQDEETLDALIEEGKAAGEGSVSEKIAKEVEKAKEKGNVTREQVKRLITSNEVYIAAEEKIEEGKKAAEGITRDFRVYDSNNNFLTTFNSTEAEAESKAAKVLERINESRRATGEDTVNSIRAEAVYSKGLKDYSVEVDTSKIADTAPTTLEEAAAGAAERNRLTPVTVEEAKKATSFGDYGAKLVADLANKNGSTAEQVKSAVEVAYMAGFTGLDGSQANFVTDTQINAFTAGKQDRVMQDTTKRGGKEGFCL